MDDEYDELSYGRAWADLYDDEILGWPPATTEVEFLRSKCGAGPVIDFGAGTGRVSIPLARAGVKVIAVDISPEMVRLLRERAVDGVRVVEGDMKTIELQERVPLVACLGLSLLQLQTQDAQLRALSNFSKHLNAGGTCIIDGIVPDLRRFRLGQDLLTSKLTSSRVIFSASMHDPLEQRIRSMAFDVRSNGMKMHPSFIRYFWPSEIVLLAEKAGFETVALYRSWAGQRFDGKPGAFGIELRKVTDA